MKIMIGVDFSELSKNVITEAKVLAHALSARVWLLHVAEPDPYFVGYEPDSKSMRDVIARKYRNEHQLLQAISEELRSDGLSCSALLVQGPTVDTILNEADKLSVDMIVLGSHGAGLLKQLLIGSTSEGVLHKSVIPVHVVPTREDPGKR